MNFLTKIKSHYKVTSGWQGHFNEKALDMLPKIKSAIKSAPEFEANQMKNVALREMSNAHKPLDRMSEGEKEAFSNDLLKLFKSKKWL